MNIIAQNQINDQFYSPIINKPHLSFHDYYSYKFISRNNKTKILKTVNGRIVIPINLRKAVITFYHDELCHPGKDRTYETINENFGGLQ